MYLYIAIWIDKPPLTTLNHLGIEPGPGMGEGRPAAWRPFSVAPGAAPTSGHHREIQKCKNWPSWITYV